MKTNLTSIIFTLLSLLPCIAANAAHPVASLIDRRLNGAADRFVIEQTDSPTDFFEISSRDGKPMISGNNAVNIAAGLNWYLKHYAGVHLSWNNMEASLPDSLPLPASPDRHETAAHWRYNLNYCTHSYSMAFWDWERWEKEIDWMALHGINMPLAMTGTDVVWRNTMTRLGYTKDEIDGFIAGPGFQAWWLMNNLEGWGGPNSDQWYADREQLQKQTLARMKELGMSPVLPGYSGMVPHDADERFGVAVSGKGIWNGFVRPAFLMTTDPMFDKIADIYYDEMTKLYGKADFYSMDPFHEGGSLEGVDLTAGARVIAAAMKRANPDAVWVVQGWRENPRPDLLAGVDKGDLLVLDLASEIRPQWGDPESPAPEERPEGYAPHNWLYCMLLNFGGNVGLHGRMDYVINEYYKAMDSPFASTLKGVGLTMEGIENNPVMYELLCELPWRDTPFTKEEWLKEYITARYGTLTPALYDGWCALANTIYNCPPGNLQQGTSESVFCARPSLNVYQVSSWSRMAHYYNPADVIEAAARFVEAAPELRGNNNFEYDLVDIVRQATAEKGRLVYRQIIRAIDNGDKTAFTQASEKFMTLLHAQDKLLATRPEFKVGTWINNARRLGHTPEETDLMESNARLLITTWGRRTASEDGGLRDYAHREWSGLLRDFYAPRWEKWFELQNIRLTGGEQLPPVDFYALDEQWVDSRNDYPSEPEGDPVDTACETYRLIRSI